MRAQLKNGHSDHHPWVIEHAELIAGNKNGLRSKIHFLKAI